jgi:uncharacterized delta-60 repeat protein
MNKMLKQNHAVNPGDLDPEFGGDGIVDVPDRGSIRGVAEDRQGRFVYVLWNYDKDENENECWLYRCLADGSRDLQFGKDGVTKWAFKNGMDSLPNQLICQADGKILLIGAVRTHVEKPLAAITRFNADGSPDLVFGNIIFPLPEGNVSSDFPTGCLQADGKILLAAPYSMLDSGLPVHEAILLRRLHANGEVDLAFGGGRGFIEVQFKGQHSLHPTPAVLSDGRILVGGTVRRFREGKSFSRMAIACFLPNGAIDQAFGVDGYWEAETEAEDYNAMTSMIVHNDRIICVGYAGIDIGFVAAMNRVTADGVLDPTFNKGETLLIDIPADRPRYGVSFNSVAVQSDGNIVGAGFAGVNSHAYWLRVLDSGVLDVDFGNQGIVRYGQETLSWDLIVQSASQRIIAAIDQVGGRNPQIFGIQS